MSSFLPYKPTIDVSIITVTYNNFEVLKNCLDSIVKYTRQIKYEIIIIDNNSTEGDIGRIVSGYDNITLIRNKTNDGFAAANNQGIKAAKGKYLLILNNDTVFIKNTIKEIFNYAESLDEKAFIGCKLLNADGSHQISVSDFDTIWNYFGEKLFFYKIFKKSKRFNRYYQNYIDVKAPIDVDIIKGAFMFCDAKSVIELEGFDERFYFYGEEVDLCARFKAQNGKIIYYPFSSIIHLGGSTVNQYQWFDFKNQVIARIQILQKHYRGLDFITMLLIHYTGVFVRVWIYLAEGIITMKKKQIWKSFYYMKQLFVYPHNQFKK